MAGIGNPTARRLGSGDLSIEGRGSARAKCDPTVARQGETRGANRQTAVWEGAGRGLTGKRSQPVPGVARLLRDQATEAGGTGGSYHSATAVAQCGRSGADYSGKSWRNNVSDNTWKQLTGDRALGTLPPSHEGSKMSAPRPGRQGKAPGSSVLIPSNAFLSNAMTVLPLGCANITEAQYSGKSATLKRFDFDLASAAGAQRTMSGTEASGIENPTARRLRPGEIASREGALQGQSASRDGRPGGEAGSKPPVGKVPGGV